MTDNDVTSACKMRAKFFVSDIPANIFWINLVAQNLGINTLFSEPDDDMEKVEFRDIAESIGGSILGHPVLAKAIMMNAATRSTPEIYSKVVEGDLGPQKIYMFKNWGWDDRDHYFAPWIDKTTDNCYDYPLKEWRDLHSMVLGRCASTHVRDIFLHFGKMEKYGAFLANIYEIGGRPSDLLRSYTDD